MPNAIEDLLAVDNPPDGVIDYFTRCAATLVHTKGSTVNDWFESIQFVRPQSDSLVPAGSLLLMVKR